MTGDAMVGRPEPDEAALLAGLIDLPGSRQPHPPGDCGALCTPECTHDLPSPESRATPRSDVPVR